MKPETLKWSENQLTQQQAIDMANSKIWQTWTDDQIVRFQLFQKKLCMDFDRFHEAIENVLKRSVFTHEFASPDLIKEEYLGSRPVPTFAEILEMIPLEKRIIITNNDQ